MKRILYIDTFGDYFGRTVSQGFISEASRHRWWSHWYHPFQDDQLDSAAAILDYCDGVVYRGHNPDFIDLLTTRKITHLHLRSTSHPEPTDIPHVNDEIIGQIAQKEMDRLDVIHRGFLSYKGVSWSESRGVAYLRGNADISYLELTEKESNTYSGIEKIIKWLEKLPKPAGIFATNDHLGISVLIACHIAGLDVPNQISVIGADNNTSRCTSVSPNLSSIDLHLDILGEHLAHLLANKLGLISDAQFNESPTPPPPSLIARESSHQLTPSITNYRKSIEWINRNALKGPSVQQLADAITVSRRALERAFKQNGANPPAAIIRQERMRQITELLLRDNVTQELIARQANFPDTPSLYNFIKRQTGKTPREITNDKLN